jgi:nucleotide-binding universal stress UspA family protein
MSVTDTSPQRLETIARDGPVRSLLGSVSHALLERADRPVVIVPTGAVDVDH